MSEELIRHEEVFYQEDEPFRIINIRAVGYLGGALLNHRHEDLEIMYIVDGASCSYIDGQCIRGESGQIVITNSGSIHHIIPENQYPIDERLVGIVLLVNTRFLDMNFSKWRSAYFTNDKRDADIQSRDIMIQLSEYAEKNKHSICEALRTKGLILQLLSCLAENRMCNKADVIDINYQKNIERIKGVLSYCENHYRESLSSSQIAEKFYFSREYFARFFKKCTGMTFTMYVKMYRLERAMQELLTTDKKIVEIALDNGFSDDRRFILVFKKQYGITPFQYRRSREKCQKNIGREVTKR